MSELLIMPAIYFSPFPCFLNIFNEMELITINAGAYSIGLVGLWDELRLKGTGRIIKLHIPCFDLNSVKICNNIDKLFSPRDPPNNVCVLSDKLEISLFSIISIILTEMESI